MMRTSDGLDLSLFPSPDIPGNRGPMVRAAWFLTNAMLFQSRLPLLPYELKASLLRLFGAKVGPGAVIKPRVGIKYPWFLEMGRNVWLGEAVWIDNPSKIEIGSNVCISQGAYLVTGNHDFGRENFRFFTQPIIVGNRVWICARAIIPPGSLIPPNTVVPIGSVWSNRDESADPQ